MRQISVKYQGECTKCGGALDVGTPAMYEKRTGIFCPGCEPTDMEDIRAFRLDKAERKSDRLIGKAERLEKEAKRRMSVFNQFRGDTAFNTQPGHIPFRARAIKSYDKGLEIAQEAREARARAEGVVTHYAQVKGDAERKRQATRDMLDTRISKGSRVHDAVFGDGTVVGIYKKSYRIKFSDGFTSSRDKSFVWPLTA